MSGKRKNLSRREAHRLALHYAICERDSFAEANHKGTPERERAKWLASQFRRVLAEEFGERTSEDAMAAIAGPGIPLSEIMPTQQDPGHD